MKGCQQLYDEYLALLAEGNELYKLFFQDEQLNVLMEANKILDEAHSTLERCVTSYIAQLKEMGESVAGFFGQELESTMVNAKDHKSIPFLIEFGSSVDDFESVREGLCTLISSLLNIPEIDARSESYIEQLIELLDNGEKPVPIQILKSVLVTATWQKNANYGAFIKGIWALGKHKKDVGDSLLAELRKTERYKTDEYIRDWVDSFYLNLS